MTTNLSRRSLLPLALTGAGLFAASGLSACGSSGSATGAQPPGAAGPALVTVEHPQGRTEVRANPQKVVVLEYSALNVLDAIGAPVTAVAKDALPVHMKEKYGSSQYKPAGGAFEPDFEAINALEPDLILCGNRSAGKYPELAKIGATVDVTTDPTKYLAGSKDMNLKLARIFGAEAKLQPRIEAVEKKVKDIAAKAPSAGTAMVLLTSAGTVTAFGPGSRFGYFHSEFGFVPADPSIQSDGHGLKLGFEQIAKLDPAWLFVIDRDSGLGRGGDSAAKILDNPLVNGTKAKQANQVVNIDAAWAYLAPNGISSLESVVSATAKGLGVA